MSQSTLDARLAAAAQYVRQGAFFADIGTDHAHLPIYLLETGRISHAVAADIAKGPLSKAEENARLHNLHDKITFRLTDGLCGLSDLSITDIAICGMGGELISNIIDAADFVRDGGVRLILQPMSKQDTLRRYLCGNGFSIVSERLAFAAGRVYSCICAEYTGKNEENDEWEYLIGSPILETGEDIENYKRLIDDKCRALHTRISGRAQADDSDEYGRNLLSALMKKRGELDENK